MSAQSQGTQVRTNQTIPPGHLLVADAWQGTQLVTYLSKQTKVLYSDGELKHLGIFYFVLFIWS